MQAIATLIHDDPYLTMPRGQRIADRARRRQLFRRVILADPLPEPVAEIEPEAIPEEPWVERQKAAWFSVESDLGPVPGTPIRISDIIDAISKHYAISKLDILSARRTAKIVRPRQIGYYLAKTLTNKSLPEIGRRFGGRDHTSALSGIRKIEFLRRSDAALDAEIRLIELSLGGPLA